jgi:hypothetical protein
VRSAAVRFTRSTRGGWQTCWGSRWAGSEPRRPGCRRGAGLLDSGAPPSHECVAAARRRCIELSDWGLSLPPDTKRAGRLDVPIRFRFATELSPRLTLFCFEQRDIETGVCDGRLHMPGDPKECREHAKRCWKLTSGVSNPILKESLIDLAQRRARLASGLWPNRISYTFHWLRTRADRERQAPDQGHLTNSAPPN